MRYFEKNAGAQAELYKILKPAINKAFNVRSPREHLNWFLYSGLAHNPKIDKHISTILKSVPPPKKVEGLNNKILEFEKYLNRGLSKIPGTGSMSKYIKSRSRTYPHMVDMFEDKNARHNLKIFNN